MSDQNNGNSQQHVHSSLFNTCTDILGYDAAEQYSSTQDWLPRGSPHYDNFSNTASALYSENGGRNQSFGQNNAETSVEVIFDLLNLWTGPIYRHTKREALDERTKLITGFGLPRKDKVLEHVHKEHSVRQQIAFVEVPQLMVLQDSDPQSLECLLASIEPSPPVTFKLYRTDVKVDLGSDKALEVEVDDKFAHYAIQKTLVNPDGTEIEGGQIPLNIVTDPLGRTKAI
ncbi:MAG: hypothetical protein M1836_003302 [Candelina mexicana]|nr:MAG: hypothetical protein M1836_003302 [Candelina mexicana]